MFISHFISYVVDYYYGLLLSFQLFELWVICHSIYPDLELYSTSEFDYCDFMN